MTKLFDTPILFIVFNRPDVTQQVFDQIKKIKPKKLFVAADGYRRNVKGEKQKCEQTRNICKNIDWDCETRTLYREQNLGCKVAVSSAITWFFENVDEGIILEDDCYPDLTFFEYCQNLLEKYRDKSDIFLIGGNNFQKKIIGNNESYYFSNYGHIWGWATWKRAWYMHDNDYFNYDPKSSTTELSHIFNSKSEKRYWNKIFAACKMGTINTWDYQWQYYIWKNKGISITPNKNLTINLGLKNNSTHYFLNDSCKTNLTCNSLSFPLVHPTIEIDRAADIYTYENIFSHSIVRIIRILNENKLASVIKYYLRK